MTRGLKSTEFIISLLCLIAGVAINEYETAKANLIAVRDEVLPVGTEIKSRFGNKATVVEGCPYPDCIGIIGSSWYLGDLV